MTTRNTTYIILASFSIVTVALVVFFIYPLKKDIQSASDVIFLAKNSAFSIAQQGKVLDDFKLKYDDYKPNLEKLGKLFVDAKDPIEFIKFLEETALDTDIDVDINLAPAGTGLYLTPPTKEKDSGVSPVIVFQISALGNFLSIAEFSEKLEKGPYLLKLYSLSIKKSEGVSPLQKKTYDGVDASLLVEALVR